MSHCKLGVVFTQTDSLLKKLRSMANDDVKLKIVKRLIFGEKSVCSKLGITQNEVNCSDMELIFSKMYEEFGTRMMLVTSEK